MISIIDYGAGNLMSVKKALDFIGADSEITADREKIKSASHVILPGVGSFGDAMASMAEKGLVDTVREAALSGKPFLGICLGLHLLFAGSDESPDVKGLGVLGGKISVIPKKKVFLFSIVQHRSNEEINRSVYVGRRVVSVRLPFVESQNLGPVRR